MYARTSVSAIGVKKTLKQDGSGQSPDIHSYNFFTISTHNVNMLSELKWLNIKDRVNSIKCA